MTNHLHNFRNKIVTNAKGFTLIELLVVIAIIGMIATIAFTALGTARIKSRDAKRKADISQLMKALELYYSSNNSYPSSETLSSNPFWVHSNNTSDWGKLETAMSSAIVKLPVDPQQNAGVVYTDSKTFAYAYYSASLDGCLAGQWYIIVFKLEAVDASWPSPGGYSCDSTPLYFNYTSGGNNITYVVKGNR